MFDYILKPLVFERLEEAISRYQAHLDKLLALNQLAQKEVDALLPRASTDAEPSRPERLPKGVDSLTLDKIRGVIATGGHWSAEEMGSEIGASRTTARRYLEFLVGIGELSAEVNYGSVGRRNAATASKPEGEGGRITERSTWPGASEPIPPPRTP